MSRFSLRLIPAFLVVFAIGVGCVKTGVGNDPFESSVIPCENWDCDSAVVQELIDSLVSPFEKWGSVDGMSKYSGGRIIETDIFCGVDSYDTLPAKVTIPPNIGKLSALKKFSLRFVELETLPDEFACLTSLEEITIHQCSLTSLPSSVGKLTSMVLFSAPGNVLDSVPSALADCEALKSISLSRNKLTNSPGRVLGIWHTAGALRHVAVRAGEPGSTDGTSRACRCA